MSEVNYSIQMPVICYKCSGLLSQGNVREQTTFENKTEIINGVEYIKVKKISILLCEKCGKAQADWVSSKVKNGNPENDNAS